MRADASVRRSRANPLVSTAQNGMGGKTWERGEGRGPPSGRTSPIHPNDSHTQAHQWHRSPPRATYPKRVDRAGRGVGAPRSNALWSRVARLIPQRLVARRGTARADRDII